MSGRSQIESDAWLAAIVESSGDGIVSKTLDGIITTWNRAAETIFGYTATEVVGKPITILIPPERQAEEPLILQKIARGERVEHYETERIAKDGRRLTVSLTVSPIRDRQGRIVGASKIVRDVTAQRTLERRLRESEQRWELALSATQDGIWDWDVRADTVYWSPRCMEMLGYAASDFVPTREFIRSLMHPEDRDRGQETATRHVLGETEIYTDEYRLRHRDGSYRWILSRGMALRDEQGKPVRMVGAHTDVTDRRAAEAAAREAEQRQRAIFEAIRDAMIVYTTDGIVVDANPAALRTYGYTREQVVGVDARQAVHPSARPMFEEFLRVAGTGGTYQCETVDRRLDGTEFPIEALGTSFTYAGKRYLLAVIRDITARKQAEAALRDSEERLRTLVDQSAAGIAQTDLSGHILFANRRFCEITGYTPDELTRLRVHDLTHGDDLPETTTLVGQAKTQGQNYAMEKRYVRKDGSIVWVSVSASVLHDAEGRPQSIMGVVVDVTDRKHAEEERRKSEYRFRRLVEQSPMSTQIFAPDGKTRQINRAWEKLWGGTMADLEGYNILQDEQLEKVGILPLIRKAFAGEAVAIDPVPYTPDRGGYAGQVRWVGAYAFPVKDDAGRIKEVVLVHHDVTERKLAEAERDALLARERAAREQAEQHSRVKDEFLATLSHELRTPLNAILGWSSILRADHADPRGVREGLEIVERNARAQAQIIDDLLDMSRIISGKVRLDVRQVDPEAVVRAAMETVQTAADAKGVRVAGTFDPAAGPIMGDPNRLQQVVWNLLSNAVKFTPRGGEVRVVLRRAESQVELTVTDTGEGITPEFLPQVFDRFRQADSSTTRRHGGLGLGLSIVKHLIEQHGGTVRAASAGTGLGSTFTILLPLAPVSDAPDPEPTDRPCGSTASGPDGVDPDSVAGVRVLVVDDEADARALVRRLLESCGGIVTTAASAAEALELLQSDRPDVLVCDIGMPEEDGYALIRRVRALGPDKGGAVPAIALTAYARPEDRVQAIRAGYQFHVAKPVEPAELIAMVASLTGRTTAGR